ncbi:ARM repeat superfamily protein isoform X2 [Tasmannia lanceolata]|uniref:ARM repeat superfamily protein isoform X2 n=1 Tax=Tasmannia lanceolata TaxID=3420 RepID=UPI00406491EF
MDESSITSNVARAIVAALDWNSPAESRNAAVSYLESIKAGDIRILANTSFALVRKDWSSEIRLHAFKMLQNLVRLRWEEFSSTERRNFSNVAIGLISDIANPHEEWALKSQTAALVAEVVRREGLSLWQELLPSLISISSRGPIEAELVLMLLRWLPEDITVHNEDLEGDRRRLLLRGLTESLPEILPLLYNLLDKHFGAGLSEAGRQQYDTAKQHATTVVAAINAVNAYAEWAPVPDLAKYGLIHGCGILLSAVEFRLHACEFFKLVSRRKRPVDAGSEFDSAMGNIFQILMNVSGNILSGSSSHASGISESEFEFAECICDSMVSLGSSHLQCIAGDSAILSLYLQQMLEYFQHFKLALHFQSLLFWLALMRESVSKPKISAQVPGDHSVSGFGQADKEKKGVPIIINDDICSAILDVSFLRMLKEKVQPGTNLSAGALELWSDDFDGKGDFSQYRSRLLELIRFIAFHKPIIAAARVSQRIDKIIKSPLHTPVPAQDLSVMESMQLALEMIVSTIFDGSTEFGGSGSEIQFALRSILEGCPSIADTMAYLQQEGRLLRGEHNLLGEAFLVMASAAGIQQQQEVLAWLLEPLSKQWMQIEWQNVYLSDPLGLVRLCSETEFMWSIYHTVTFFEKALKRSAIKKASSKLQIGSLTSEDSTPSHPMASHLSWMLPPLLRLLRSIHSLWSPPITQVLPVEIRAAMSMSQVEQASLLGEGNYKVPKNMLTYTDSSQVDINKEGSAEANENNIRNWLKGIRDSGYNVLGLSTTVGGSAFRCLDIPSVALALTENIQSMEFRHIRLLVHLVLIPLVKFCPADLWEEWLEKLLHPLFLHCHHALSCSWSSLLRDGRAKVPDNCGNLSGLDLKVEVMEEKLLRDLTREICSLLSVLASPGLNKGIPSLEQFGHASRAEMSSLKELDAFATGSLVGFLLNHKAPALPALQICVEAFAWTDGESVAKIASFCGAVVLLAASTNNMELGEFVAKDLFYAIIQGLALESNAIISADLVGLCREIFIFLSDRHPAPRQVLLSLPCITEADLRAFEDALAKTCSPKEQKQNMRSLLLLATGNKLKALAAQKSTNVITNVYARTRNAASVPDPSVEGDSLVGLAAIT